MAPRDAEPPPVPLPLLLPPTPSSEALIRLLAVLDAPLPLKERGAVAVAPPPLAVLEPPVPQAVREGEGLAVWVLDSDVLAEGLPDRVLQQELDTEGVGAIVGLADPLKEGVGVAATVALAPAEVDAWPVNEGAASLLAVPQPVKVPLRADVAEASTDPEGASLLAEMLALPLREPAPKETLKLELEHADFVEVGVLNTLR